ncbi:hypothetical protein GCM10011316_25330 [Roseibium aquae]|uniref:DAGKc domain-containing protein n=1 Tax=Roseibium aquae TaxID=1323746 RepID=A0A916X116_9HYPH|nr:diacylglycerol kinase family protein [Roseibium aquae]GGB52249.1 hypothetical protein GCM10011316_25330 [Roseibium aquae]
MKAEWSNPTGTERSAAESGMKRNRQRILVLANPTAGGYRPKVLEAVRENLSRLDVDAEFRLTSHAGEIGEVCSDPDLDVDVLVIAGGDGSVNEAMTGLQDHPKPPALCLVPFGTANVLAHELKLPADPGAISDTLSKGKTRPLHAGLANGRPFVLMASAGFDAEVVHALPLALKRRFGKLAYVLSAIRIGFRRKTTDLQVHTNGRSYNAKMVIATNGKYYGGPFCLTREESVCRPGLHLILLKHDSPWSMLRFSLALVRGRLNKEPGALLMPITRATITSVSPVALQIDGDPYGTTPVEIEAAPACLQIVVP